VIRYYSESLWGSLSELLLVLNLLLLISSWSNKEYLLREFSKTPAMIKEIFWSIFFTRFFLLIPVITAFAFFYQPSPDLLLPASLIVLLRFTNNSFEPLYTYFKKFGLTFIADLLALAAAAYLIFYFNQELNLKWLCRILAIIEVIKLLWYSSLLRKEIFWPEKININFLFFLKSAPFFAVGIISFMQSKTDQFLINYFLPDADKAVYQVLTNLLMLLIAIPTYITSPFMKNIYRMKQRTLNTLTKKIVLLGCVVAPVGVFGISIVVDFVYKIKLTAPLCILSILYALPAFYFSLKLYQLFKEHKDKKAATIIFIAFLINAGAGFFLIPKYGIAGGLSASILSQFALSLLIFFSEGKNKNWLEEIAPN
jgi:O-antigen/teichoic acid export membrane protein